MNCQIWGNIVQVRTMSIYMCVYIEIFEWCVSTCWDPITQQLWQERFIKDPCKSRIPVNDGHWIDGDRLNSESRGIFRETLKVYSHQQKLLFWGFHQLGFKDFWEMMVVSWKSCEFHLFKSLGSMKIVFQIQIVWLNTTCRVFEPISWSEKNF